jgi:TRAP-type C4-dicarboxylate transport system permease small subunit
VVDLLRPARAVARAGTWFGGALVALSAAMISVDVLTRKLFSVTFGSSSEISGYVLAIGTTWSLALALLDRAHVRIDSLYVLLPPRVGAVLDLVALASFMVFGGLTAWQGTKVFMQSASVGAHSLTPLSTPLAVPQFLWAAGFVMFVLVMLLLAARAAGILVRGRLADVPRLLGPLTAEQEVEEAMEEHARYQAPRG